MLDFIKSQLAQGISEEKIQSELISNGWNEQDIKKGFRILNPTHSKRNIFITAFLLFLIVVGISGYFFRDNLKNFPIIRDLVGKQEEIPVLENNIEAESI